jgi:bifunctional non-homologous end joining protein LigD
VGALPANSFLIDGEAIVTNAKGLAVFNLIRQKCHGDDAVLIASDLIELDGQDMSRSPIEDRKRKLTKLVRGPASRAMATSSLSTPASSAAKASSRSGLARLTVRGIRRIG